ncbi:MAG TPA: helix-turn-helix transcriptional regulator [Beijerinckiaceae bacterium]|jgi:DNA-binding transcriptional ArsR family regulator
MIADTPTALSPNTLAGIAALIGDPARANMLFALMAGRALTAGELAYAAGISASTASGHLAKLKAARLTAEERQGRHRYHRLASPDVAQAIEGLMNIAAAGAPRQPRTGPRDEAMRAARTCYDHLAGRLGTALADSLAERGHVVIGGDGTGLVTEAGSGFLADFGIDLAASGARRPLCRTCLDWSERRPHFAGRLGTALRDRSLALGWIAPVKDSRAVAVTQAGRRGYAEAFGIRAD